jgi:hypothetical protein
LRLANSLAVLVTAAVLMSGCGSGGSGSTTTTAAHGSVPSTTQRVYLATALACQYLGTDQGQGVVFKPLKVKGRGYSITIDPTDDCREQRIFNSYLYEVPTPTSGNVRITPGNQPPAVLDAAKLTKSGVATVFYARKGEGRYAVTVITYRKDEEVKDAP